MASLPKEKLDEFSFNNSAKLEFSGGYSGWAVMDLLVPTYECNFNQLRKIGGNGDGAKWICGDLRSLVYDIVTTRAKLHEANGVSAKSGHKPCVIYSLGSNGKFEFEQAANTEVGGQCEIHTFDCTGGDVENCVPKLTRGSLLTPFRDPPTNRSVERSRNIFSQSLPGTSSHRRRRSRPKGQIQKLLANHFGAQARVHLNIEDGR